MLGIRGLLHIGVHSSASYGQVGRGGGHGLLGLLLLVLRFVLSRSLRLLGRRRNVVGRVKIRDGSDGGECVLVHAGVQGGRLFVWVRGCFV